MARKRVSNIERTVAAKQLTSGMWEAFVRHEDTDGKVRPVTARGETKYDAIASLSKKIANRVPPTPRVKVLDDICADHTVAEAAAIWLAKEEAARDLGKASLDYYRRTVNSTIKNRRGVRSLKIGAVTAGQIEKHMVGIRNGTITLPSKLLKRAGRSNQASPSQAQNFRKAMSLIIKQAIRDGARIDNPIPNLKRAKKKVAEPVALTNEQIETTRSAIALWRDGADLDRKKGGRPRDPDGVMPDLVSLLLGTGIRISEALALRPQDCVLDAPTPYIRIRGTVKVVSGEGLIREDMVKTDASNRDLAVPKFVIESLRRQLGLHADHGFVFTTSKGTLVSPNNVRRNLRTALKLAGVTNAEFKRDGLSPVTPHAFRRTLATGLAEAVDDEAARDYLGHASVSITKQSYIQKQREVIGDAALIQDLFGRPTEDDAA
ncbi:site-specific integrase [Microbacterium capsulatum]|uniref:Site-specific integrase n=1 Tax=Microbacterium capsulatum TaxID=3041921 RepID=A0ABU0XGM0_9MICO|nr:site-specific integrase [Microbacterium sp. ASV81]MDQ4214042.1 site-specific integrase [Microbacterium sp. ASV81]